MAVAPPRTTPPSDAPAAWHALPDPDLLGQLGTSRDGLDVDEVRRRQAEYGPNVLPARKPASAFVILLHQFASPLIYILLAAGVVSSLVGDATDAAFIFGVVLINAGLGAFQEYRAEKSAESLQRLLRVVAHVQRDGAPAEVSADELVPGDVVLLESGTKVPADLRILTATNLATDEALLTGESVAATKQPGVLADDTPVSDRRNMAFAGSIVATGRGLGVVVATGLRTQVGRIAATVTGARTTKPPLLIRLEKFSRDISLVVVVACLLLGLVALARGMALVDVFFLAVALAVSAIPEGLPVAITLGIVNFYLLVEELGFSVDEARNRLLLLMVLIENYHVFNCRSEYVSAFRVPLSRNWVLIAGVAAAQGLHILAMHVPVGQRLLLVAPISLWEWIVPFAMAASVLAAMEVFKLVVHGRAVAWPVPAR